MCLCVSESYRGRECVCVLVRVTEVESVSVC